MSHNTKAYLIQKPAFSITFFTNTPPNFELIDALYYCRFSNKDQLIELKTNYLAVREESRS